MLKLHLTKTSQSSKCKQGKALSTHVLKKWRIEIAVTEIDGQKKEDVNKNSQSENLTKIMRCADVKFDMEEKHSYRIGKFLQNQMNPRK